MFNYIKQLYNKLFNNTTTVEQSTQKSEKRVWVTNGKVTKLIQESQLEEFIVNGYKRGRKLVK